MNYKNLKFLFLIGITKNEGRTNIKNIAICFISVGSTLLIGKIIYNQLNKYFN